MRSGVNSGVRAQVRSGVNAAIGGLSAPPASAADWTLIAGMPTPLVAHGLQDASGDLIDMMGVHDFEAFGTVGYEQAGLGTRKALLLDGACGIRAKNTTLLDPDGTSSFSFFLHVNSAPTSASARPLFGKRVSTNLNGFFVRMQVAAGTVRGYAEDGVGATGATDSADSIKGVWSSLLVVIDRVADQLRIETPGGTSTLDISSIGSMAAAIAYSIGAMNGLNPQAVLVDYHAAWVGLVTREQYLALGALFAS